METLQEDSGPPKAFGGGIALQTIVAAFAGALRQNQRELQAPAIADLPDKAAQAKRCLAHLPYATRWCPSYIAAQSQTSAP